MATAEKSATIPQEDLDALQEAIDRVVRGIRDPSAARVRGDGSGSRRNAALVQQARPCR
jgi:hypothetical protein